MIVYLSTQIMGWRCHCCLSPCQFASLAASRLTLSGPHNLSVALSIWSRDDDTSNHAPVHRCDDALSPLLFSNVFTSLTYIGTRTVLLHEEGRPLQSAVSTVCCCMFCRLACWSQAPCRTVSLPCNTLNPLSTQHSGSRIDVPRSIIQVRLLDSGGLHLKAAIP